MSTVNVEVLGEMAQGNPAPVADMAQRIDPDADMGARRRKRRRSRGRKRR